ncbi:MAG: ATPase [Defluviitaleaceae bacterium]|nr:ATPase [Defluviitaleaceae bacterium]
MDSLLDYLDQIEDILDASKSVPFSNKISVEKERVYDVMNEIRLNLPNEIRTAQRIIEDHDKIMADARSKAASILKEAEEEAKLLTNDHEIFRRAAEQATETIEETKKNARDMRLNAMDYADEILEKTENMVKEAMENIDEQFKLVNNYFTQTIDVLYENRQSLRGR